MIQDTENKAESKVKAKKNSIEKTDRKGKYVRLNVRPKTHIKLQKISDNHKINMIDLMDNVAIFFERSGFDPKDLDYRSPTAEIKNLRSTVIGFIKKQEQDILLPMTNKMDSAISILVEFLKQNKPNIQSGNLDQPLEADTNSDFKPKTKLINPNAVTPVTPIINDGNSFVEGEYLKLKIETEKQQKTIERYKANLEVIKSKLSPKTMGSGFSINITKEEIEYLFS